jgi:hypothetical protein
VVDSAVNPKALAVSELGYAYIFCAAPSPSFVFQSIMYVHKEPGHIATTNCLTDSIESFLNCTSSTELLKKATKSPPWLMTISLDAPE